MSSKIKIFLAIFLILVGIGITVFFLTKKSVKLNQLSSKPESVLYTVEVINWNFSKQLLETKEYPLVLFKLTIPQTRVIIPLNKPDKPKDEHLVLSDKSTWWPTAFCPGDKLEIQLSKDESVKLEQKSEVVMPLRVRNLGPRACSL